MVGGWAELERYFEAILAQAAPAFSFPPYIVSMSSHPKAGERLTVSVSTTRSGGSIVGPSNSL